MMTTTPGGPEFEKRLSELKEVKLKLPLRHHVRLQSLKLLKNRSISDLVAKALDVYFAKTDVPGLSDIAAVGAAGLNVADDMPPSL